MTREQHTNDCGRDLDLHHIIPERKGGENTVENLLPVCRDCHQTLEKTQGKALGRITEKETDQGEMEQLKTERDKLRWKVESLEEKIQPPTQASVGRLVDYVSSQTEGSRVKVDFHIVSKRLGNRTTVAENATDALESYEEWGDKIERSWVAIEEEQMRKIVKLVLLGLQDDLE